MRLDTRGSITVEAALILPILVIVFVPFLYLIRMEIFSFLFESDVQNAMLRMATISYVLEPAKKAEEDNSVDSKKKERAREAASEGKEEKEEAYDTLLEEVAGLFGSGQLGDTTEDFLLSEAGCLYLQLALMQRWSSDDLKAWGVSGGWSGIGFWNSEFFYTDESRHSLLKADLNVEWSSMAGLYTPEDGQILVVLHSFNGEKHKDSSGHKEKTEEEEAETVYRIGQGARYHSRNCYLIDKTKTSMSLGEAEAAGYVSCSLCGGGSGTVYVSSGGECHHTSSCSILFPNLSAMTLEEAKAAGLTPCGLCYGDVDYFH